MFASVVATSCLLLDVCVGRELLQRLLVIVSS